MKKRTAKLTLSTETIRQLTDSNLSGARGGCWVTYVSPCDPENPIGYSLRIATPYKDRRMSHEKGKAAVQEAGFG